MSKKLISVFLCVCMIMILGSVNVFAEDAVFKTVSGIISLPNGETAPAGGLNVFVMAIFDNGTPDNRQDDRGYSTHATIPEGQGQADYMLSIPDSSSEGRFTVYFAAEGCFPLYYTQHGGTIDNRSAEYLTFNGGNLGNINVTFVIGRTLSGTIRLPSGEIAPAGGVNVDLYIESDNGTPDNWQDNLGVHAFFNIPEGQSQTDYSVLVFQSNSEYTLRYEAQGYSPGRYSEGGNCLIDLRNGNKSGIDITLSYGKRISGTVSLPDGVSAPPGGLNVLTEAQFDNGTPDNWQDDRWYGSSVTIPEGQHQAGYTLDIPEFASGVFKVRSRSEGYFPTYFRQQGGTVDYRAADYLTLNNGNLNEINITLVRGRKISGTVKLPAGDTAPAGGVNVELYLDSDNGTPTNGQDDIHIRSFVYIPASQSQADYSILVFQSNSGYTLRYQAQGYDSGRYSEGGSYLIDLRNGDKSGIDFTLSRGKVISGTISLPDGVLASSGGVNVYVTAYSNNGTPNDQSDDLRANTNAIIPEGQNQTAYSVTVPDSAFGYTVSSSAGNGDLQAYYSNQGNTLVNISDGNKDNINMKLTVFRKVSGIVSLPEGAAPAGGLNVSIAACFDNGTPDNRQDDRRYRTNTIIPGGQSQASFMFFVPGPESEGRFTVESTAKGYFTTYYTQQGGTVDYRAAESLYFNGGNLSNINTTLVKGRMISGAISLPEGDTATAGGIMADIYLDSDNGTPNNSQDDIHIRASVNIPEGQNQSNYSILVFNSNSGYSLRCEAPGYVASYYRQQGGTSDPNLSELIDLKDGDRNNVDIVLKNGKTLNITASNGTVTGTVDKTLYYDGEKVTLKAVPDTGYRFICWSGDASGSNPVISVIMDGNKNITAVFTKITPESIEKIEIPKEQKKLDLNPGDQIKIELKVIFTDGVSEPLLNAVWTSSDKKVAAVENGVITAIRPGDAKITASYMGQKVTILVDVRHKH